MPKLEPYSRKLSYSYALGVFPSLMLMEARPEKAVRLLLHPEGLKNEGVEKLRRICAERGVREEMAERVLRGLLLPENRELLDTLLCYLKTNCNARAAAEQMYLHVNTLHYRLKKIQAILNRDLGEMDDLFDVMLALKILVFLHSEERDLL